MGLLKNLLDSLSDGKTDPEKIIKQIEEQGNLDADSIAQKLGQEEKNSFVPHIDVPPIPQIDSDNLPDGCKIAENGEIERKTDDNEEEQEAER